MKKLLYLCLITVVTLTLSMLSSCSGDNKKKVEPLFTAADTAYIVSLTDTVMQNLSEKNFDEAFRRLYDLSFDNLSHLSNEECKALAEYFSTFPVLRYKLESMEFNNEYDVTLTYLFEFFDKPEDDNIPNTMKVTFAPQRFNNRWFLALQRKSAM